ncbi:MAG: large conductance mechanosensitive channel protein MscL [Sphingobium sp.]|nr:large conductance mechanosensitive channel protein MscL [Sphingobium sp.]
MDLAVGVIIGAAFGKIVTSLTDDVLMPTIGLTTGGIDFSNRFLIVSPIPAGYTGSLTDYAALKKAGVAMIGYGSLITAVVNFLIMAFVIFLLVRLAHKLMPENKKPGAPSEIDLLTDIRDELARQNAGAKAAEPKAAGCA